jgi:hypothetical protein
MASDFDDFVDDAADLFGLDPDEATDLLERLEEDGFTVGDDDLSGWMPEAFDLLDEITDLSEFEEPWWDEELDPDFPDDDWLDPYEEWEITAEYEEV